MDSKICKAGFVTLIGRPNVGKSTLMNQLIGQKIAITSAKPQTTRNRIRTVLTTEKGQIVFLDTPGIHKAKNKLGDYMVNAAEHTLEEADVILWLVEPTNYIGAGEHHIIEELKKVKIPVILVINKTDTVKREQILSFIDTYRKELDFAEIVPVSALKGDNTDELVDCIFQYLPEGHAFFDGDTITDQPMRQIVAELIREKALRLLEEEIPHGVAVSIESMKESRRGASYGGNAAQGKSASRGGNAAQGKSASRGGNAVQGKSASYGGDSAHGGNSAHKDISSQGRICHIEASIICERDSHKGIIIGRGGQMLKRIGTEARKEIEEMMEMQVNLKLFVKVKKDWRDSDYLLKNFGYNPRDISST